MKTFAIIVLLIALFLLYRIAYQKTPVSSKSNDDFPEKEPSKDSEIIGKSAFVRSTRSQLMPIAATSLEAENQTEKADIFAPENNQNDAVIPPEELDEVFEDRIELDIPLEEDETDGIDAEEEAEELRQTVGNDAALAGGFSYEEMTDAISNPSGEKVEVLYQMEQTDFFEQLVSGNARKALQIKAVIDRHIQNDTEGSEENNNEYGDFDIADYLN